MTRKDYIKLADMVVNLTTHYKTINKDFTNKYLISGFCALLSSDNSQFDSFKFRNYINNKLSECIK